LDSLTFAPFAYRQLSKRGSVSDSETTIPHLGSTRSTR